MRLQREGRAAGEAGAPSELLPARPSARFPPPCPGRRRPAAPKGGPLGCPPARGGQALSPGDEGVRPGHAEFLQLGDAAWVYITDWRRRPSAVHCPSG